MKRQKKSKIRRQGVPQSMEYLKWTVRRMYDAQKLRISSDHRMQQLIRDGVVLKAEIEETFSQAMGLEVATEKEYARIIGEIVRDIPIVREWLGQVRGIGPRLSGLLVALIGNIGLFPTISKLWAYAGLHVIDGRAPRCAPGEKANWNWELKTTSWKVGQSFVKLGGPYREMFYDPYKEYLVARELANGKIIWTKLAIDAPWTVAFAPPGAVIPEKPPEKPEWSLGRINNMSCRRMVKIFLSHLWLVWRELEKLPVSEPYVQDRLGHQNIVSPWAMISDSKDEPEVEADAA